MDGFEIEVGPDFGFEDKQERGPDDGEGAAHAGTVIERGVEEAIDERDRLTLRGFAAGDGGDRKIKGNAGEADAQLLQ